MVNIKKTNNLYNNANFIVTGATGYVGNMIVKKLLSDNKKVVGLIRNKEKASRVFKKCGPQYVIGDIRDDKVIEELFKNADENTIVIHTAAEISIGEVTIKELYEVNVEGTRKICEACLKHNIKKLLHISSSEAIPHGLKLLPDLSNYVPNPKKVRKGYNRSKSLADEVVLDYVHNKKLDASILIIAGVLGPGDHSISHMSQVMIDYVEGRLPVSIAGGYNDFDIRDITDVLENIVNNSKSGEAYLFANRPDSINEVLGYVKEKMNCKKIGTFPIWAAYMCLPFLWLFSKITAKRPLYTLSALESLTADVDYNLEKVKNEFGYFPRDLKTTVNDHIDFLIENGYLKR
ncbi:MAG: SDR family NAD(P)-dependent oxidoreductase [Bacilli bacterium]